MKGAQANSSLDHALVKTHSTSLPKIWDCIPFGFELEMLWLHMKTLEAHVTGFIVTESETTHTTDARKRLLLTEAIANKTLPKALAGTRIVVRVVDFVRDRPRFCGRNGNVVKCFENFQRFLLLEKLFEHAAPGDLALFGDVDEIARPSVVNMLAQCRPFSGPSPSFYVLRLSLYKFGVQCAHGNTFGFGTRAFSVDALRAKYGQPSPSQLGQLSTSFSATRMNTHEPTIPEAGWHLTSFGEPWELARKLQTWLHADIFRVTQRAPDAVSVERLERCMRYCLELDRPRCPCSGPAVPASCPLVPECAIDECSWPPPTAPRLHACVCRCPSLAGGRMGQGCHLARGGTIGSRSTFLGGW